MKSLTIAGAMEGDCLPSGHYVVNFWAGNHLETGGGTVAKQPPQKIRFPRLSEDGVSIAGQGQESGTWDWNGQNWLDMGPCSGTSPVIFDRQGVLHVVRPGPDVTSQGYRCLDGNGQPMLGDATMVTDVAGRLLHEYTPLDTAIGRILIGQDHDNGVHLVAQGVRRWLTDHAGNPISGATRFVRARVSGSKLAVTVSRFDHESVIHVWMDLSEVTLLPAVSAAPPKEPPPPPPPPPVDGPPKEQPVSTIPMHPRVPAIVQALYERNVNLAKGTDDQRRELQMLINEQARFELGEEWGAKRADPGRPISKDSIGRLVGGVLYYADCFNGTTRLPSVPPVMTAIPDQVFEPVQAVNHLSFAPPPDEPPVEKPPAVDVKAIMDALERYRQTLDDIAQRVTALEARPVTANISGRTVTVRGNTSKVYGHGHSVDFKGVID